MTQGQPERKESPVSTYDIRLADVRVLSIQFESLVVPKVAYDTNAVFDVRPGKLLRTEPTFFEVGLTLRIDFAESAHKLRPFNAEFSVAGIYKHKEGLPEPVRDYFVSINGPIMLWPYMRELVASTTARAGFPPLLITTLDVPRMRALAETRPQQQK